MMIAGNNQIGFSSDCTLENAIVGHIFEHGQFARGTYDRRRTTDQFQRGRDLLLRLMEFTS
jgi:hypothetical protein